MYKKFLHFFFIQSILVLSKNKGVLNMENQLNFEAVSDEELLNIVGGINLEFGEGGGSPYGSMPDNPWYWAL